MLRPLIGATAAILLLAPAAYADTRTLDAKDFTGVDIASGIHADITIGAVFSVVAESSRPADLTELRTEVSGGQFHARYDWNFLDLLNPAGRDVRIHITMPALDSIDASSGSVVSATGPGSDTLNIDASSGATTTIVAAAAKTYAIDVSSGAGVTIGGTCQSLRADASSGASANAKALACADVSSDVSSGAHTTVTAQASINGDASSGGGIDVFGGPATRTLDSSSGGSIHFLAD